MTTAVTKTEFAVNMTCEDCVRAVQESLSSPQVQIMNIDLQNNSVLVESSLSTTELLNKIETSGRKVVVKGLGGSSAGVAILDTGRGNAKGVVRFVQLGSSCIVDGTVDGLQPGQYQLTIHESGDISQGCDSCGEIFNPQIIETGLEGVAYGDLGQIEAKNNGRSAFRFENNIIKLPEIIGRSVVISQARSNGDKRLICGIIARSAGLFENPKTICACSGASIWDETNAPVKPNL